MAISLGQLDLEALKNYLKIVQGFRTVNDPAGDTINVAGIPSELIAHASEAQSGGLLYDRSTVDNALNLIKVNNGVVEVISADQILTEEEGKQLQHTAVETSKATADDMRALRNEMYHLKRDMIRSGALSYDPVYEGYIDPFLQGLELFTLDPLMIDAVDGANSIGILSGDIMAYEVGQYAAVMGQNKILSVSEVTDRLGANLILGNGMSIFSSSPDQIAKSYGLYDKGRFVFAAEGSALGNANNEVNMIYKDGTDRVKVAELNQAVGVMGFASTIVVPAELDENYLSAISVSLRKTGGPGACYLELYDYNVDNKYGDPIATSNYLNSGRATDVWATYKFTFDNEVILEKGHIYMLVIKAAETNKLNMWYVGGFAEQCNYNIHQDTYLYTTEGKFIKEGPDVITNQVFDMFMGLYTTETRQLNLEYAQHGLYTGSFDLEHDSATRVRVSFNPRKSDQYYNVVVKGKNAHDEFVFAELLDKKQYNHTTWVNGELSGLESVYDFAFNEQVTYVEFQIIFDSPIQVSETNYEALFAVVVSTDNAYLEGGNN